MARSPQDPPLWRHAGMTLAAIALAAVGCSSMPEVVTGAAQLDSPTTAIQAGPLGQPDDSGPEYVDTQTTDIAGPIESTVATETSQSASADESTQPAEPQATETTPVPTTATPPSTQADAQQPPPADPGQARAIEWDDLIADGYSTDDIMSQYGDELNAIDDTSEEAYELLQEIMTEMETLPINTTIDGAAIELTGYIAPLDYADDQSIIEFLLVPYQGACIHSPPPPPSQTILVRAAEGQGISFADAWGPVTVKGTINRGSAETGLAVSGFTIDQAQSEPFSP